MIIQPAAADVFEALFKRRWLFLCTFFLVTGLGAAYLLIATPRYASEAAVIVRFDAKSVADTNMAGDTTPTVVGQNDRREIMQSHSDILNSPDLATEVINSVGLATAYPAIVADPPTTGTTMDMAIKEFNKRFNVKVDPLGDVLNISFAHPSPAMAQEMLRRILQSYMRREVEAFSGDGVEFQQQQVQQAEDRLNKAQAELKAYKAAGKIAAFDDQIAEYIKQRSTLQGNMQSTQVALAQAEQRRDELRRQLRTVPASLASSATEKYRSVDDAQAKLADLRTKEQELLATYRPESRVLTQLRASISTATSDLAARRGEISARDASSPNVVYQSIQTDLLRATAEATSNADSVGILTKQIAALDGQIAELEARRSGLEDRTRTVGIAEAAYRALSLHLEDSRVGANRMRDHLSHGAVIAEPTLPYKVASPRYIIFAPAFFVVGLLLASILAIVAERLDGRFTTSRQIEPALRLPVLASLRRLA